MGLDMNVSGRSPCLGREAFLALPPCRVSRPEQCFKACSATSSAAHQGQRDRLQSCSAVSRRASLAMISLLPLLEMQAVRAEDENPGLFRAENSNAENAVENVKQEEKVAISSVSSTDPLVTRSGDEKLQPGQYKTLKDETLAYSFSYPVNAGSEKLKVILSRRPERYSSAPPLAPAAGQRIVSELVDFGHGIVISTSVGPPTGVLKDKDPKQWRAKDVANTVLQDRSTARVTEGQRVALQQVENVLKEDSNGTTYWTYEHLSQGSPNMANPNKETYRHAIAVTAWRPGLKGTPFLYTLNLSCPDEVWDKLGPLYQKSAASFRLDNPGKSFIQPDKDPWRFF